jgi:hypothetical protein
MELSSHEFHQQSRHFPRRAQVREQFAASARFLRSQGCPRLGDADLGFNHAASDQVPAHRPFERDGFGKSLLRPGRRRRRRDQPGQPLSARRVPAQAAES